MQNRTKLIKNLNCRITSRRARKREAWEISLSLYIQNHISRSTYKNWRYRFLCIVGSKLNIYTCAYICAATYTKPQPGSTQFESNTLRFNTENAFLPLFSARRNENSKINILHVITMCLPQFPVLCLFFFTLSSSYACAAHRYIRTSQWNHSRFFLCP